MPRILSRLQQLALANLRQRGPSHRLVGQRHAIHRLRQQRIAIPALAVGDHHLIHHAAQIVRDLIHRGRKARFVVRMRHHNQHPRWRRRRSREGRRLRDPIRRGA